MPSALARAAVFCCAAALFLPFSTAFAAETERPYLAVTDLAAQGVKAEEAAVISDELRVQMAKADQFRLIERAQMQAILKEQGFQQSGCTSDECAIETGQLLGVRYITLGSLGVAGSYTLLSIRVIDVKTGENILNESVKAKGGIDAMIDHGISDIVGRIKTGLSDNLRQGPQPAAAGDSAATQKPAPVRKPARVVAIASASALVVGGGVVAAILLTRKKEPQATGTPISW